jgi:hypothetical protein
VIVQRVVVEGTHRGGDATQLPGLSRSDILEIVNLYIVLHASTCFSYALLAANHVPVLLEEVNRPRVSHLPNSKR